MPITFEMPSGQSIVLESHSVTVGRDQRCDVRLPDQEGIHPIHAKIIRMAGRWMIESEGDWLLQVNDGIPGRKCWLNPGDRIRLTDSGPMIVFQPHTQCAGVVAPTPETGVPREMPPPPPKAAFPSIQPYLLPASKTPPVVGEARERLPDYGAYLAAHFIATRWPAAFGVCCGMLAVPVISFLKPVSGLHGMVVVLATVAGVGAASGLLYLTTRWYAFWIIGANTVPNKARSSLAAVTHFCLMCLVPLVPLLIAECFTPPHGLLATIVPQFQTEQARWLNRGDANRGGSVGSIGDGKSTDSHGDERRRKNVSGEKDKHAASEMPKTYGRSSSKPTPSGFQDTAPPNAHGPNGEKVIMEEGGAGTNWHWYSHYYLNKNGQKTMHGTSQVLLNGDSRRVPRAMAMVSY